MAMLLAGHYAQSLAGLTSYAGNHIPDGVFIQARYPCLTILKRALNLTKRNAVVADVSNLRIERATTPTE